MEELIELCKQQGINLEGVSSETLSEMEKHFKLGYQMAQDMDNEVNEVSREEFESLKKEVEELKIALTEFTHKI